MKPVREDHPLKRFFRGLIENVFAADLGMCSPVLVDYLASLLTDFIHVDRLRAIRDADGKPLDQIAEMLALIARTRGESVASVRRKEVIYRHIGDYTLFWSGVYPESLRSRRAARTKDRLLDYVQQGKRSYAIASDLSNDESAPPRALLRQLSEDFECCAHGLELVRREWEQDQDAPSPCSASIWY